MSCLLPQARNLREYWDNIVGGVDCITDVPPSRWNVDEYYDPDPRKQDKTYCKRGGFIPDLDFNPMEFGLPPNILEVTDVSQMLSLVVAKQAITDAGYGESKDFNRDRTGVILGVGGGQKLITPLTTRLQYPVWEKVLKSSGLSDEETQKIIEKIKLAYIGWEENSFPGMLGNVIAGRIANRLDLGGINCVVDAACASSLSALRMALSELTEYRSDMMIVGGVDTDNSIFMYMCFSKTPAFSKQHNPRPFDANSDGMMLGEGIGMMVLKRLADAQRDGDRIYAVIKGIGTSSDGKYKSIYAPRSAGQAKALRRAYEDAGFAPSTVGLIEAHGTGTLAGDPTEFSALKEVFSENNPTKQYIALGSVKSQIGHTKATAGAASLIKTALALHHKILPPTINITKPNAKLQIEDSPFYLNTETRPWIRTEDETPRRAGVSSFGFGGTNYHVVLEEYESEHNQAYRLHNAPASILLCAATPGQLLARCETVLSQLQADDCERYYVELIDSSSTLEIPLASARVGFVTASVASYRELLLLTIDLLKNRATAESWEHPQGIYYRRTGIDPKGKIVALFSGQGSQYLDMGKELVLNFPSLRQAYADMDRCLRTDGFSAISNLVFPCPVFDKAQQDAQVAALQQTENAQPAIGVFSFGLYKILQQAGFKPDFVAGHSFGELTALWAAGVLNDENYFFLVKARGQAMASPAEPNFDTGTMLAVKGDVSQVTEAIKNFPKISIANWNANNQVVLAGTKSEITKVQHTLETLGYSVVLLPVAAAFHSPLVADAQKRFAQVLSPVTFNRPKIPVYSNTTGNLYPNNSNAIRQTLASHILNPVHFKQEIENIYAAGGYFFVEIGPRNILTNLVKNILEERPHLAVAVNASRTRDSPRQLHEAVVQLRVAGLHLHNLDPYQVKHKASDSQPKAELNVRLNGSNYVSEKTKAAFEQALQNGHQVKYTTKLGSVVSEKSFNDKQMKSSLSREANNGQHNTKTTNNGQLTTDKDAPSSVNVPTELTPVPPASEAETLQMPQSPINYYQRILESLDYNMTRFHEHQAATLREYLKNQQEYSQQFFQLMQQHYSLLAAGNATAQHVAPMPVVPPATEESHRPVVSPNAPPTAVPASVPVNIPEPVSDNGSQLVQTHRVGARSLHQTTQTDRVEGSPSFDSYEVAVKGSTPPASPAPLPASNTFERNLVSDEGESGKVGEVLNGGNRILIASHPLTQVTQSLLEVVSEKTGYPAQTLDLKMDMEADLGIDSIKRVEILGEMQELFPDLPPVEPEDLAELRTLAQIVEYMGKQTPPSEVEVSQPTAVDRTEPENGFRPQPQVAALTQSLLEVVSEKTGYPAQTLDLEMDMEADLGIDSIKRVEILGVMQELFPDLPPVEPEDLAELRTLAQIVNYMGNQEGVAEKKTLTKELVA